MEKSGEMLGNRCRLLGGVAAAALTVFGMPNVACAQDSAPKSVDVAASQDAPNVEASDQDAPGSEIGHWHARHLRRLQGATYLDANVSVKIRSGLEAYLAVDNFANKDPAQMASGRASAASIHCFATFWA